MKKQLAITLASAMMLSGVNAFASTDVTYEESPVSLIYNAKSLSSDGVEPVIIESRTMLPFRALLENIGATVGYDEPTRMVTAQKDDTTITFSLDSVEVSVQKGEEAPVTVTPDVPNVILSDRVYVPVRFMAESFGMQVGWDADLKTAIIIDIKEYCEKLFENSENLKKYLESVRVPENFTQVESVALKLDIENLGETATLSFDATSTTDLVGSSAQNLSEMNFETDMLEKFAGLPIRELKNVTSQCAYQDGVFYIKTNAIDKLKEIAPDHEFLNSVSQLVSSTTWYKADMVALFEELELPTEWIELLKAEIRGETNSLEAISDAFERSLAAENIDTVEMAEAIDMVFDTMKTLFTDEIFVITQTGENSFDMEFKIDVDTLIQLIEKFTEGQLEGEEEIAMIREMFQFELTGKTSVVNGIESLSEVSATMSLAEEGTKVTMTVDGKATLEENSGKTIEIPEVSVDLINLLKMFAQ